MKSTLTLLFCLQRAILYPKQKICVVTPTKEQSSRFISKAREFMQESPNLMSEIKGGMAGIHTTPQNTRIDFTNESKIFAVVYGEGSLGKPNLYISNLLYNKSKRRKV